MNRGAQAEQLVTEFLQRKGYHIVQRNVHCRFGEIDIIAENGRYLAFVEVRCRAENGLVHPLETVTAAKQRKVMQTAMWYLQQNKHDGLQPRFDVAAVTAVGEKLTFSDIQYIENAFGM